MQEFYFQMSNNVADNDDTVFKAVKVADKYAIMWQEDGESKRREYPEALVEANLSVGNWIKIDK